MIKYLLISFENNLFQSTIYLGDYYYTIEKNYDLMKKYYLMAIELNNSNATEVLDAFKKRIKTPEGQKRLKNLGITNTQILDDLKIVEDENTLGHYWMEKIGLNPNLPEFKNVTRHEIEHAVKYATVN